MIGVPHPPLTWMWQGLGLERPRRLEDRASAAREVSEWCSGKRV